MEVTISTERLLDIRISFQKNELRYYSGWLNFAKFAANLANFAEIKSWYGEGTELVRSGSNNDILWDDLQKHGKKFGRYRIFSYICTV